MGNVLVIVELVQGRPAAASLELLGLARGLAAAASGKVSALLFSAEQGIAETLIAHGADGVFAVTAAGAVDYNSETWLAYAERAASQCAPTVILATHTTKGADLAPRLAFRLKSAAATGCVAVVAAGGALQFTRTCYGGSVHETLTLTTVPAVATVRGGACDVLPADTARRGEITMLDGELPASRIRVLERHKDSGGQIRLEDARVIVAGGRGLNGPEGFHVLEVLAAALGGVVGASRVPCDLGWCPHALQIGLTGRTVAPDLYIAVGISGASHHLAGCGGAKTIVAINTDPDAAIFREARFGIIGDFQQLVPALAAALQLQSSSEQND